jgi:rSAM/selenodomain-associated transferase 2
MKFSVVVATWNEGAQISSALKRLRQISQQSPMEIIVVDGGSTDDTIAQARDWADQIIAHEAPNRGAQLHAGAQKATGDLLFFLRADSQPPGTWQQALEHFWLKTHSRRPAATVFTVDYGTSRSYRLAARAVNTLVSWRGLATGDHGLCTTPDLYRDCGGYPAYAYREDLALCERLQRLGEIVMLPEKIWPAARRMHQFGPMRCALSHAWLELRYKLGASPDALWRSYAGKVGS